MCQAVTMATVNLSTTMSFSCAKKSSPAPMYVGCGVRPRWFQGCVRRYVLASFVRIFLAWLWFVVLCLSIGWTPSLLFIRCFGDVASSHPVRIRWPTDCVCQIPSAKIPLTTSRSSVVVLGCGNIVRSLVNRLGIVALRLGDSCIVIPFLCGLCSTCQTRWTIFTGSTFDR